MGRGRQRAKQAKVARELKYRTPQTDLVALQRELASTSSAAPGGVVGGGPDFDETDEAATEPISDH